MSEKKQWHRLSVEETAEQLDTDLTKGIQSSTLEKRKETYGLNELEKKKQTTVLQMFLEQFKDYMILILMVASIVSIFIGEVTDAVVILAIVVLNACFGVYQEYRAGKALEALQKMSAPNATVIRDGELISVPSIDIVPGDIVQLDTGDYVPADVRIIESTNLQIDEAALTGESVPVNKLTDVIDEEKIGIGDQKNLGFMSTLVTYGRGKGVVVGTGMNSVIGKIAELIQVEDEKQTPLQKNLNQLSKILGNICLAVCAIVFVLGIIRGEDLLDMFMTAVSLAVAAIPEGLPAVVTIVLALGMQRMVKHNAIMKKLHAVETLGSTTVICSDKTGTLTQNQMTIVEMYLPDTPLTVTGEGYEPKGDIQFNNQTLDLEQEPALKRLVEIQAFCNDSRLEEKDSNWTIAGDPTEGAMRVVAEKAGYSYASLGDIKPRLQEIPFDSTRKLMTTFHEEENAYVAYTKGAPDVLLERSTHIERRNGDIEELTDQEREQLLNENKNMAKKALRVLGMAYKKLESIPEQPSPENSENELIFSGLVGMIDPARPEVIDAVGLCKEAGIRTIMITGDYRETAAAIAKNIGIIESDDQVMNGLEIDNLTDEELQDVIKHTFVFARVSPEHKVRIVQAVKSNDEVVAMTGDGVNDAPALKRADIGIAMGITGTDVTKETADMILTDDNFASIVSAVEEGRVIYSNIRKFVFFLLSCNVGEILCILVAMLMNWPIPLLPIHLLWINLVTDAFPALALGAEKKEPGLMKAKPRSTDEPIINRDMIINIAVQSIAMTIAVLFAFYLGWNNYGVEVGRTYAFVTLITCELLRAYSARSEHVSLFKIGVFSNKFMNLATVVSFSMMIVVLAFPALREIFDLTLLDLSNWEVILIAILPVVFGELTKVFKSRTSKKPAGV